MVKKILLGVALLVTILGLLAGGVYRTLEKTSDNYPTQIGNGRGQDNQNNDGHAGQNQPKNIKIHLERYDKNCRETSQMRADDEFANGQMDASRTAAGENRHGANGAARDIEMNEDQGISHSLNEEELKDLISLEGVIASMDLSEVIIISTSNGQIVMEGRTLSFAVTQGFSPQVGDLVLLQGFYEDEDFEIVQITNQSNGQEFTFRESSGRPLWAGGGRTR